MAAVTPAHSTHRCLPLASPNPDIPLQGWRLRLYTTIFEADTRTCHGCLTEGHLPEALYCLHCGARLPQWQHQSRH